MPSLADRARKLREEAALCDETAAMVSLASDKAKMADMAAALRRRADELEMAH